MLQAMRCGNSLLPLCPPGGAGGSCRNDAPSIPVVHGPAHTHGHKGDGFSLCGLSGALHSCSPMAQHCLLATEELSSWATSPLTGKNKMNEVIKDT